MRYAVSVRVAGLLLLGMLLLPAASLFGANASASGQAGPVPTMPRGMLPGDNAIGPAALDQENPQIAAGGGGYLVVWEDSRGNYASYPGNAVPTDGNVSGQTLKDIFAARLDANGNLVDTVPIEVSQAKWDQTRPRVAWNGQYWLVVWNTQRATTYSYTTDVAAARVSPSGSVLDQPAIVVDTHVKRVANRLDLTRSEDPVQIEQDLQQLLPSSQWTSVSQRLLLHGRYICLARRPLCGRCSIYDDCYAREKLPR